MARHLQVLGARLQHILARLVVARRRHRERRQRRAGRRTALGRVERRERGRRLGCRQRASLGRRRRRRRRDRRQSGRSGAASRIADAREALGLGDEQSAELLLGDDARLRVVASRVALEVRVLGDVRCLAGRAVVRLWPTRRRWGPDLGRAGEAGVRFAGQSVSRARRSP